MEDTVQVLVTNGISNAVADTVVVGTNALGMFLQKIALRKFKTVNGCTMLD